MRSIVDVNVIVVSRVGLESSQRDRSCAVVFDFRFGGFAGLIERCFISGIPNVEFARVGSASPDRNGVASRITKHRAMREANWVASLLSVSVCRCQNRQRDRKHESDTTVDGIFSEVKRTHFLPFFFPDLPLPLPLNFRCLWQSDGRSTFSVGSRNTYGSHFFTASSHCSSDRVGYQAGQPDL